MNDQWTNRLSEYIDGELTNGDHAALEAHLETCASCHNIVTELRQVVTRARTLADTGPATDLWPEIRDRMIPARGAGIRRPTKAPAHRLSFSVPQLLAASIALMLMSGGGAWLALRSRQSITPTPTATATPRPRITAAASWTDRTDDAIAELQATLAQNEQRLDTATVRIVRKNLAVIDRAIAEARIALRNDPGNAYLNLHLANTMRRKVELLRRVNEMAAAES